MRPGQLKRTINDRVISVVKAVKYALMERHRLDTARASDPGDDGTITVVIPTRDRWELLVNRALPSVLCQQGVPIRVIIVQDGGKCPTREQWAVGLLQDPRVKILRIVKDQHYPNVPFYHWLVGPSNAMNHGMNLVHSSWVARLDDDDRYAKPDVLCALMHHARQRQAEFVSAEWMDQDGCIAEPYREDGVLVGGVQTWLYRSYLKCFEYNLDSWRKAWDKNNEIDLYKRMLYAGVRFTFCPMLAAVITPRPGVSKIGLAGYLEEYHVQG